MKKMIIDATKHCHQCPLGICGVGVGMIHCLRFSKSFAMRHRPKKCVALDVDVEQLMHDSRALHDFVLSYILSTDGDDCPDTEIYGALNRVFAATEPKP